MKTKIYLIRHGETDYNRLKIYYGIIDIKLNKNGLFQAKRMKKYFESKTIDFIYSSPLKRTIQTTKAIFGKNFIVSEDLKEMNFGEWEGLNHKQILEKYPEKYKKWLDNPLDNLIPGGEGFPLLSKRVNRFFYDLLQKHLGKTIAVVTHAGVIRTIIFQYYKKNFKSMWDISLPPLSIIYVEFEDLKPKKLKQI